MGNALNPYESPDVTMATPSNGPKHIALTIIAYSGVTAPLAFFGLALAFAKRLEAEPTTAVIILGLAMLVCIGWWLLSLLVGVLYLFWKNSRSTGAKAIVASVASLLLILFADMYIF